MTQEGQMPTLVFRSSFAALWRWISAACAIGGVFFYGVVLALGLPIPFGITFGISTVMAVVFAVAIRFFPVYVRADGIRCYDFGGIYHTIPWGEIARVRRAGILGLRYLVASDSSGRREVWIPLYLSDMPNFALAIRACAGDEHPLVDALP